MEVERTAHVGVAIDARALLRRRGEIEVVGQDGSDTFGVQRADRKGVGRHVSTGTEDSAEVGSPAISVQVSCHDTCPE